MAGLDVASGLSEAERPGSPAPLPPGLAVLPGSKAAAADGEGVRLLAVREAQALFAAGSAIVAHAALTARRLGLASPPRSRTLLDVLELFVFVRPAKFCAPSPTGLARALGLAEPVDLKSQARLLRQAAAELLAELGAARRDVRFELSALLETLERAGWSWSAYVRAALGGGSGRTGGGLEVWADLKAWEETAPPGETGSRPVAPEAARRKLAEVLAAAGLDEARPAQADFASETAFVFGAREREGAPLLMLADAGTGTGKTLGYLAPASLFAADNGPSVWVSTYTRALQRQIEREAGAIFPDPATRAQKAVVRKGRENYLCLLNFQDAARAASFGGGDLVGAALTARWIGASRDGDMTGGDYPAWLPTLFAVSASGGSHPAHLIDRRGECVHAACPHHRVCFVERAIRASRTADIVIANHALVLTQAAFDGARRPRAGRTDLETASLKRLIFDEGHHLFDAADAAFSACLSGQETAELRRWVRGPESRRRGRGLDQRIGDLVLEDAAASEALGAAIRAAAFLPAEGWSARLSRGEDGRQGLALGPLEAFLAAVADQLAARADRRAEGGQECAARPCSQAVLATAALADEALAALETPLERLLQALEDRLDQAADELSGADRARIEGALRGLERRSRMQLRAWRAMLASLQDAQDAPAFVDWFEAGFNAGRLVDVAFRRHWVDPTEPLERSVLRPAHGVLVTSATLADMAHEAPFALAEMRTGAARLSEVPKTLRLASPFDYASQSLALVLTDVGRDDPRRTASAMRELFLAAGGGGLGLFTAIRRLREVYGHMVEPLSDAGLPLYAQHVDPLEISALIDIFRAEQDACLLGTDAVRDGVDVPGRSLRLLAFDRVPWPRPDLLHKARRDRFGGRTYDDAIARGRIAQAFGRLIRRADDRGVFVMLDAAAPTRLFSGFPEGVTVQRLGLSEGLALVRDFLGDRGGGAGT